jgi:YD repeat-containing protein
VAVITLVNTNVFAATYSYDELNRLKAVTYGNGKIVAYTYDAAGNILSTTLTVPSTAPSVTTNTPATSIAQTTAAVGGNVTSDGGAAVAERGVVYAVTANPTITAGKVIVSGTTGTFAGTITGLTANTTYHARAYATNSVGTSYGVDVTFTTAVVTLTVTPSVGTGGTMTPATTQTVNANATTSFTVTPSAGYSIAGVTGCNGTLVGSIYTTGAITVACTVNATFNSVINGACGSSNGGTFSAIPATNLCATGTASAISGTGPWSWTCNGGTTANCTASIDIIGPALVVSTLANGSITNVATLNISGTVSDTSGVAGLTINSSAATVSSGSFSYPVTLQAGANTITIIATDNLGNNTTNTRTVILDQNAPTLTVTAPADNSNTAQPLVTVTGTINENSTVAVTPNNGSPQNASITGSAYSATINLVIGLNTITIAATDLAGNTSSAVRTVTYDNTNPALAITNPVQDITTSQNNITISGTVSDTITNTTIAMTTDGHTYTPLVTKDGSFSQSIPLPTDKTYAIVVTATDQAGNSVAAQRNIIKYTTLTQPTISDALKVLQAVVGITPLTATEKILYDVAPLGSNGIPLGNGIIDAADVILILRRSIGIGSW